MSQGQLKEIDREGLSSSFYVPFVGALQCTMSTPVALSVMTGDDSGYHCFAATEALETISRYLSERTDHSQCATLLRPFRYSTFASSRE